MIGRLTTDERAELESLRRLTREQADELQIWRASRSPTMSESDYWRRRFGLSRSLGLIVAEMAEVAPNPVSRERLLDATAPSWRDRSDGPEIKIVDVYLCRIRKILADLGLPDAITTHWGFGYSLSSEAAAFLRPPAQEKAA